MQDFLKDLNQNQHKAATTIDGPLLILAGAGSGKTKTITTRLAYLIECIGIPPENTLTLTFTNKAANEMQQRALSMISNAPHPPLLCTFHKFGLLFLKFYITELGRKVNFILNDSDDTKRILKEINKDIAPLPLVISEISRYKNSQITPQEALKWAMEEKYEHIAKVYAQYQEFLFAKNLVDFDDLLLLPIEIMQNNPKIAEHLSQKYQYIMVDEYQDTNFLQVTLLKLLCLKHQNLCVVGDDDQSIYSWRGAMISNILNFQKDFKGAKTIKLEENYRSTSTILNAANKLIANNKERLGKKLKSTLGEGKDIALIHASSAQAEAQGIASRIKELLDRGISAKNIAVLFRINALSRSLEEEFNRAGIPYVLVGTIRFYERSEIKDILSYFRVLVDLNDDFSLLRIINKPKRGIGKTSLERLNELTKHYQTSIFGLFAEEKMHPLIQEKIGKKPFDVLLKLFNTLKELQEAFKESPLGFIEKFEESIRLCEALEKSKDEIDRVGNIEEFYEVYRERMKRNPFLGLEDFLNELALRSDQEDVEMRQEQKGLEGVSCMSVHSSKGLEFDYVFIMGLEEGFFPLSGDGVDREEERRLGYVAFTRAKKELFLSYVDHRRYRGDIREDLAPSTFLKESGVLKTISKPISKVPSKKSLIPTQNDAFKKGDCVIHNILGAGRIVEVTRDGGKTKLKINFGGMVKNIYADYVHKV